LLNIKILIVKINVININGISCGPPTINLCVLILVKPVKELNGISRDQTPLDGFEAAL
jgi:hypothetical protein